MAEPNKTETPLRCINGIPPENWNQFILWAKRLGMKQAELFSDMMAFYFEQKKDELTKKLNTIEITVREPRRAISFPPNISPLLQENLAGVLQGTDGMTAAQLREKSKKLTLTYVDNKKFTRKERMAAEAVIVQLDRMAKQKESG